MILKHISHWQDLPIGKTEWNELCRESETNTPFQTYEWISNWWSVFGDTYSLSIIIGIEDGRIIGIAPLMHCRKFFKNQVRFIADTNSDYCDLIVSKNDKANFIATLVKNFRHLFSKIPRIFLKNIPGSSQTVSLLKINLIENKFDYYFFDHPSLTYIIGPYNYKLSNTKSKDLKRKINLLSEIGELNFTILKTIEDVENNLEPFFEQHISRWMSEKKKSLFLDHHYVDFYKKFMTEAIPCELIFFSCLRLKDHPIAFHLGFDYNSKVIWYKPSFDIEFAKYSPGKILVHFLKDYSIRNNKQELDFTIGNEKFKYEHINLFKKNFNACIFNSKLNYLIWLVAYKLKSILLGFKNIQSKLGNEKLL